MKRERQSMKNVKQKIGTRKAKPSDSISLGVVEIGKARKAPNMVEIDVTYDDMAEKNLYKTGMRALKHDKKAVISYVIMKALEEIARCKK